MVQVQIISEEELLKMIRTRQGLESLMSKYEQAQRRLENLLKQIEDLQKELKSKERDEELRTSRRSNSISSPGRWTRTRAR